MSGVDGPSRRSPPPSGLSRKAVTRLAETLCDRFGYLDDLSIDSVVRRLGGQVLTRNVLGRDFAERGSLEAEADGSFTILRPFHTGPQRDRFTIAHDLGHLVLHYHWANREGRRVERLSAGAWGTGQRAEFEANWFAYAFLMPTPALEATLVETDGSIAATCARFDVSVPALRSRLRILEADRGPSEGLERVAAKAA